MNTDTSQPDLLQPLLTQLAQHHTAQDLTLADGTRLICPTPHVGPQAFLHALYPPLTSHELDELQLHLGMPLPAQLQAFYASCNGFNCFSDAWSIDGWRRQPGRELAAARQPYDLRTPNVEERPADASEDMVFFGGYDWDGSRVYTRHGDEQVHLCGPDSSVALRSWPSLAVYIADEAARLGSLFDADGRPLNPDASTLPL